LTDAALVASAEPLASASALRSRAAAVTPAQATPQLASEPAPRVDSQSLALETSFPACPSGTKVVRQSAADGRVNLSCARSGAKPLTPEGPSWTFFSDGHLARTTGYSAGLEQGASLRWYRSGVRRLEGAFEKGKRQGDWRAFHPNGTLADTLHYEVGKLDGPRQRFFASGRSALNAHYGKGVPSGKWSGYYDQDAPRLALELTLQNGREAGPVSGFLPDGKPFTREQELEPCAEGAPCVSPLGLLDVEALPPLLPERCPSGRVARAAWPPIVAAARQTFRDDPSFAPSGCVDEVTLSCATDLDGLPGAEVLVEIAHRMYQPSCAAARRNQVSETRVIVALSPQPNAVPAFLGRAQLGYRSFDAPGVEAGTFIEVESIVRLPSGDAAVRTFASTDAGDCGGGRSIHISLLREGRFRTVAVHTLNPCNGLAEPPENDPF
jgi:hypothetical protein